VKELYKTADGKVFEDRNTALEYEKNISTPKKLFTAVYDTGYGYCGGLAVIAALNQENAEKLIYTHGSDWQDVKEIKGATYIGLEGIIESDYHAG